MKPVHFRVTPGNAFYKQTPAEWAKYFRHNLIVTGTQKVTKKQYDALVDEALGRARAANLG